MVKIWAKILKDDKILKDTIYTNNKKYSTQYFMEYLTDICYLLDIATPLLLKCHKHNFSHFNIAKFRADDFVDEVNFDLLILENAAE